ncbi:MAG TPA: DNA methyltransferase [Candidatus Limnocylindrales bacterium]|nr:DNA methyltransferase [Candidatus Limnocylindrales bacterium]
MSRAYRNRPAGPDGAQQHRDWLALIEVTGPFLSLPVLRQTWPTLDPLDKKDRERLRVEHATWLADPAAGKRAWLRYILGDLLGWASELRETALDPLTVEVAEHDTTIAPSFVLVEPGSVEPDDEVKPDAVRLLGLLCSPGAAPTARIAGSAWAATPVDRLAHLCRHHNIELGLATDGRWWALVWAPRGGVTTVAVFDAISWQEAAERDVVRAFLSLLCRRRFFGVPEKERLIPLLHNSKDNQEDITEALGVQVRRAVELLVAAIGRADVRDRDLGGPGLAEVSAHEVYHGAVTVMMRLVFLLFAEERGLLPSDNDLYATAYAAGGLRAELEQRAIEGSEEDLEHTSAAWHRLLALFIAVYRGIDHPRLKLHGHDGSLFDPDTHPWLPLTIDDRTVLHMLRAVQRVQIGTGRSRETRTLSFRTLDVEQIGYVYEGLLSFEGFRAEGVTVGLVGKEGLEDEVPLAELEALAAKMISTAGLADALVERYKDSGVGSAKALEKRLATLDGVEREEARKRLLAVTGGDYPLAERLLPFAGIIRADLRGLPVVILPGALYVTESALRKNTGTHYTPRFLAEEVVEGALEPLVYAPGPLQTADTSQWKRKSSQEILALKVADIAMGSAAFLVAAARYLAGYLIEAWSREGDERAQAYLSAADDRLVGAEEDPLVIEARRQVIEHCLYGVDINPMAVEMAKLSLWLVSMDPVRPFTFLDDRLVAGDSLLGITSLDQLKYMHMDPKRGREIHERSPVDFTVGVRSLVGEVAEMRRRIAEVPLGDDPLAAMAEKRRLLKDAEAKTEQARFFADLTVGAALANVRRGERGLRDGSITAADFARRTLSGSPGAADEAASKLRAWLATDHVPGSFDREPLHWPLVFPEVFEQRGFDAVIGNPPFLGGKKISGANGSAYREFLVEAIGRGVKGNADLIAYFELRAHGLLDSAGQTGLIGTNTLAQGDTREVGLDQLVAHGVTIRRAVKSQPWPSRSAVLEYCAVWTSRLSLHESVKRIVDGVAVAAITPSLDPESRAIGNPHRLVGSSRIAFIGNFVNGIGFVLDDVEAAALINADPSSAKVLHRYLNGQDLNSRPDLSASRWIIDFEDWPLEQASQYKACLDRIRRLVKPARDVLPDSKRATREKWWQYEKLAPGLRAAIKELGRVIVIARISKTAMPVMVTTGQVMNEKTVVFATDDAAMLALLSSAPHYWWVIRNSATLKTDLQYAPSDVFETLALPELTPEMRELGDRLDTYRRDNVMLARQAGLTATYNLVNDPGCHDEDIMELRRIHRAIDEAVCRAYRWNDLVEKGLDHGFHAAGRETRYTVGPAMQREFVDRLLELNHERHAEEVKAGLHDKKKRGAAPAKDEGMLF